MNTEKRDDFAQICTGYRIVIALVFAIIQFVIMLFMMLWLCTQEVTYKLKAIPLIRNSFLFTIALAIQTLFIMILCDRYLIKNSAIAKAYSR